MPKTFYLWDLAGTLFPEKWDSEKSGFESYEDYVESLGYDLKTITPREWEYAYEKPYREGLMNLEVATGFKEILSWTKNNAVFTTGNKEQIDWRAEQLQQKYGFDIRDYIKEIFSTFDYGNINVKTREMMKDILQKKKTQGFEIFVYTDDKLENCQIFLEAFQELPPTPSLIKEGEKGGVRIYHILNVNGGLRPHEGYWEIGNLYDMMENEKRLTDE